ncbi:hypothetical protein V8D89_000237 [Ganoderma adspersum]
MSEKSLVAPTAATGVVRLSSRYVVFDSENSQATSPTFNWDGFKDAIVTRSKPDLVFVKEKSTSIVNHTTSVDDMAGQISQFLHDTFSLQGTDNEELHLYIRKAFEDVSSVGDGGFFSSHAHESHGRAWEYRLVSSAQHPDDADSFWSLPSSLLVADIYDRMGLFGIGNESKHDFSVHIRGV